MMFIANFYTRYIVIFIFISTQTGCVNLDAVGEFSEGAQALADASGKFYNIELETDHYLAAITVDLSAKEKSPACKDKQGGYMTPWDCATKGESLMSEVRRNHAAVNTLSQYAKSLNQIATFNDDENIEKYSQKLSDNLSNLANTLNTHANKKEEYLAHAISDLANIYNDIKVRKIIFQKIKLAQKPVENIVNMLRNDIRRQQQRFAIKNINSKATREEWYNSFRKDYQSSGVSASKKVFLTLAAGKLVRNDLKDKLNLQPAKLFLEKLDQTAESCLKAHKAIQNPDLSDKAGVVFKFVSDAHGLLASVNQLRN